jgi:hypothetical protein
LALVREKNIKRNESLVNMTGKYMQDKTASQKFTIP